MHKIEEISLAKIKPNTWNYHKMDKDMLDKLSVSLEAGQVAPIILRELDNGEFEIIDGEQRWNSARNLNWETLEAINLGRLSDERARVWTIKLTSITGIQNSDDLTILVENLMDEVDNVLDLAKELPFNEAFYSSYDAYLEALNPDIPELERQSVGDGDSSSSTAIGGSSEGTMLDIPESSDTSKTVVYSFRVDEVVEDSMLALYQKICIANEIYEDEEGFDIAFGKAVLLAFENYVKEIV